MQPERAGPPHLEAASPHEMDWCVRQVAGAKRLLEYELRLEAEVFEGLPVTGLCLSSEAAASTPPAALAAAAAACLPARVVDLDLSGVDFVDAAGAGELARSAVAPAGQER